MFKLADITFYANAEYADTPSLLSAQRTSLIYIPYLQEHAQVEVIKHYTNHNIRVHDQPGYHFFKAKNRYGYFGFRTARYVKQLKADIILVEGLIFPLQVICMRYLLGKQVKFIAKHQAERPAKGLKKIFQSVADRYMAAYLFTSFGNAYEWLEQGVIHDAKKIYEIPATITGFSRQNQTASRQKTNMSGGLQYLWVGRLNPNKDPFTVLRAFERFVKDHNNATLHMIFQTDDLIAGVKEMIYKSPRLSTSVILHGYIAYAALESWYSAADFFISASHSEGGCTAVLEAMACGCIPIVSRIPASMKMICDGEFGLSFPAGNVDELYQQLTISTQLALPAYSERVEKHFTDQYSAIAVAGQMRAVCETLLAEK